MLSRDIQIDKPLEGNAPNKFHLENRVKGINWGYRRQIKKDTYVKRIMLFLVVEMEYWLYTNTYIPVTFIMCYKLYAHIFWLF